MSLPEVRTNRYFFGCPAHASARCWPGDAAPDGSDAAIELRYSALFFVGRLRYRRSGERASDGPRQGAIRHDHSSWPVGQVLAIHLRRLPCHRVLCRCHCLGTSLASIVQFTLMPAELVRASVLNGAGTPARGSRQPTPTMRRRLRGSPHLKSASFRSPQAVPFALMPPRTLSGTSSGVR